MPTQRQFWRIKRHPVWIPIAWRMSDEEKVRKNRANSTRIGEWSCQAMGLLPDTQNCGCACAGNAGNVSSVTACKRSRHASRTCRDPGTCATCNFTYLVRGPCNGTRQGTWQRCHPCQPGHMSRWAKYSQCPMPYHRKQVIRRCDLLEIWYGIVDKLIKKCWRLVKAWYGSK